MEPQYYEQNQTGIDRIMLIFNILNILNLIPVSFYKKTRNLPQKRIYSLTLSTYFSKFTSTQHSTKSIYKLNQ